MRQKSIDTMFQDSRSSIEEQQEHHLSNIRTTIWRSGRNFPSYLSADARFNHFRLQPSRVTFGAVRFDADAKMKRVELRNEVNSILLT